MHQDKSPFKNCERMEFEDMQEYMLEAIDITKRFPGVLANDNVCLNVKPKGDFGTDRRKRSGKIDDTEGIERHLPYRQYMKENW